MRPRLIPALATAALAVYIALPAPVAARWFNPDTFGYCATGTCNRSGGIRAANIKFCKPENCRDFTAVSIKTAAPAKKAPCPAMSAAAMAWPWSWLWPRRDCGAGNDR
jgi:hypothetical protein